MHINNRQSMNLKRRGNRSRVISKSCWLLIASAFAVIDAAQAQTDSLEEVVVTARQRAESITDVPAAVNAFNAATIETKNIEKPADFLFLTPNVTFNQSFSPGETFLIVRGIGQNRNAEPPMAIVIDGVLQANAGAFNQELFDIQQIEVVKGPQGALYGRNAIAGAIIITTKQPTDELSGQFKVGYDDGPGFRLQGQISGPVLGDSLKGRLAISHRDSDGFHMNEHLNEEAQPLEQLSGRATLLWEPIDNFSADLRVQMSNVKTQGFLFQTTTNMDANELLPIRLDNPGISERDLTSYTLRLNYDTSIGELQTVTAYDTREEIVTGDGFDFLPEAESFWFNFIGSDLGQSMYYDDKAISQDIRFVSPSENRFRWIVGGYVVSIDRFISAGTQIDTGNGVFPSERTISTDPRFPQFTFLADEQNNVAWAIYANANYDITDRLELSVGLRYDEDEREITTDTPQSFLDDISALTGVDVGQTGEVRTKTFDEMQPKITLRYDVSDNASVFAAWGRGFRSGGFNQTGIGAIATNVGIAGIEDLYQAEVADTYELGIKGTTLGGTLRYDLTGFYTDSEDPFFFVFEPFSGTQNLGNIDSVKYHGYELGLSYNPIDNLTITADFGFTDSEIKQFVVPEFVGNQAPLVSRYTANLGVLYTVPIGLFDSSLELRGDYRGIGRTYYEQENITSRDPLDLLDLGVGLVADTWSLRATVKNATDREFNAEFVAGGFVYKDLPRQFYLDFAKSF